MNVELLLKVRDHILEDYRRLNMSEWIVRSENSPCGTAGCIAGWTCILSGENVEDGQINKSMAMSLLGIGYYDAEQLFFVRNWPARLAQDYYEAAPQARARVVAEVIDKFINK